MAPAISIALATCNGARFLEAQLDSLARQTMLPAELQVGDDQSDDATVAILEDFARRAPFPVTIERNPQRLGYGQNFIATAQRCRGDWIGFCDQDDFWLPDKLATVAAAIENGPADTHLIVHNATVTDQSLSPRHPLYDWTADRTVALGRLAPDWVCPGFLQTFRAELVRKVDSRDRPSLPGHPWAGPHDLWTCILGGALGPVIQLAQPLVKYRRHDSTVTQLSGAWPERSLVGDNSAEYEARSGFVSAVAARLRDANHGLDSMSAQRLAQAAARFEALADRLERRVAIYRAPRLGGRLRALAALAGDGAYLSGNADAFGLRSLAKDAAFALLPRRV